MGTQAYNTLRGRIRSDSLNGRHTSYLSDALGTIAATANSNAQVVNTYRFKPFGGIESLSGTGAHKGFTWIGALGYRSAPVNASIKYVRARSYQPSIAGWTSTDPLLRLPIASVAHALFLRRGVGLSPYGYVSGRATSKPDASGLCPVSGDSPVYFPNKPRKTLDTYRDVDLPCNRNGKPRCGRRKGEAGETGCNFTAGVPYIRLCDNKCTCECTLEHEIVHVSHVAYCCSEFGKAWRGEHPLVQWPKTEVWVRWNAFLGRIQNWSECEAYTKTVDCLFESYEEYRQISTSKSCLTDILNEILDYASCANDYCPLAQAQQKPDLTQCGIPVSDPSDGDR